MADTSLIESNIGLLVWKTSNFWQSKLSKILSPYKISLNDQSFDPGQENSIQLPLTKKINRVTVETDKICQGIFERWINLDNQAKVFPNPIPENANIILPQDMTVDLNLFSGSGEVCWTKKGVVEKQESIQIPMSHLPKGWYILQIDYGSYTETRKLLKE